MAERVVMAVVLMTFERAVHSPSERLRYLARVCGQRRSNGLWEGWIEFEPVGGGLIARTDRETTQRTRAALAYWAEGLSQVYLEGALARALEPRTVTRLPTGPRGAPARARVGASPIIDPFAEIAKGEEFLRRQLAALDPWHLRNIARAFRFAERTGEPDVEALTQVELVDLIAIETRRSVERV